MATETEVKRQGRLLSTALNLPNQITIFRLLGAAVTFVFIDLHWYWAAFVLFVVATASDWLDGYLARKYGLVTTLGRILDPFVDKVIICGTFIYLVAIPDMTKVPWGLRTWMVVVILARELLVTALRSFFEERGSDFSANMSGKLKMVLQCLAAGTGLFYLAHVIAPNQPPADWLWWVLVLSTWSAVLLTIYSGLVYIWAAMRLARNAEC